MFSKPSNATQTGCPQYASDSTCGRQRILKTYLVTQLFPWSKIVTDIDFNTSLTLKPIQELPSVAFGILFCGVQTLTTKSCEHPGDNVSFLHQTRHSLSYGFPSSQEKRKK